LKLALALFAIALCAWGCGGLGKRDSGAASPVCGARDGVATAEASALLLDGARVFYERCSPCHGDAGLGNGVLAELLPIRPRNYHVDPFKWGTSAEEISHTIRVGRSGVMPAFEGALTEREIRSAAFLVACWVERRPDASGGVPR